MAQVIVMNSKVSQTSLIGFWYILPFLLLAPVIAVMYAVYSFGYWMKANGVPVWLMSPYILVFAIMNTLHNWTVCSVLFRELPREFFTTQRLKRWKKSHDQNRRELADLMGGLLDSQDPEHY